MAEKEKDYWYPHSPAEFKRETMHLTDDQELIYRRLRDYYMEVSKGPLPDNDQALANIARISIDRFSPHASVIRSLFKLSGENNGVLASGWLKHTRMEGILSDQRERSKKRSGAGKKGAEGKHNKNKAVLANAWQSDGTLTKTKTDKKISSKEDIPKGSKDSLELSEAFVLFNETAARVGIPQAQRLNPTREKKLAARLKDAGGLEGWKVAMEKMAESDFCSGRATDFKATLDFLLQESSFTKLMEGNYDNRDRPNGPRHTSASPRPAQGTKPSTYDAGMEGFSRAAAAHARGRQHDGNVDGESAQPSASDLFAEGKSRTGKG